MGLTGISGPSGLSAIMGGGNGGGCSATINRSRLFTAADAEYFTVADPAFARLNDQWALFLWAYAAGADNFPFLASKYGGASPEWELFNDAASGADWRLITFRINATAPAGVAQSSQIVAFNTWFSVYAEFDGSQTIGLSVDNETLVTKDTGLTPNVSTGAFQLGARNGSFPFDGRQQQLLIWKGSRPSADDRTTLHNAGAGGEYRNLTLSVAPTNTYPLNEESGNAVAVLGGIDLTDTNGVTSAAGHFLSCA